MAKTPKGVVGMLLFVFGMAAVSVAAFSTRRAFGDGSTLVGVVTGIHPLDIAMSMYLGSIFLIGFAAMILGLLLVSARFG